MVDNMAGFGARRFAEKSLRKQEEMRRYEEEQRRYEIERARWEQEQERLRWEQEQQQQQQQQQQWEQQQDWNYQGENNNYNHRGYHDNWDGNGNANGHGQYHDDYRDDHGAGHPSNWNNPSSMGDRGYDNQDYHEYQVSSHSQARSEVMNNQHEHQDHHFNNSNHFHSSPSNPRFDEPRDPHHASDQGYSDRINGDPYHDQQQIHYGSQRNHQGLNGEWEDNNLNRSESFNSQQHSSSDEDPYASNDWSDLAARPGPRDARLHASSDQDQAYDRGVQHNQSRRIPERSPTIDSNGSTARLAYGSSSDEADTSIPRIREEPEEDEEVFRPPARSSIGNSTLRGESSRNRFTNSTLTARSIATPRASNYGGAARETVYDDGDEYEEEAWNGGDNSRYTRYEGGKGHANSDHDSDDYNSEDYSSHPNASPASSSSSHSNQKRRSRGKVESLGVHTKDKSGSSRISGQPRLREKSRLGNGVRGAATTSMYAPAPQAKCADCGSDIAFEDLADHQCTNAPLKSPTNLKPLESPTDLRSLSPSSGGSASPSFFDKYHNDVLRDGRSNSPAFAPPSRSNSEEPSGLKSPTPSMDSTAEERRRQIEQQRAAKKKGGAAIAATAVMASLRLAKGTNPSVGDHSNGKSASKLSTSPTSYETFSHREQHSYSSGESSVSSLLGDNERRKQEMTPSTSYEGSLSPPSPKDKTNSPALKDKQASRSKTKPVVDSQGSKPKSRSRSRSDSASREERPDIQPSSKSRSQTSSSKSRSRRLDSRSSDRVDSDSDATPAQSPNISATSAIESRNKSSSSSALSRSKQRSDSRSPRDEVDIGQIETLMNDLTSSSKKSSSRGTDKDLSKTRDENATLTSRARKISESDSPRKKDREREREASKESTRTKSSSTKSPTKSSKPELSIRPGATAASSIKEREKQKAERKHRKCAICQCSLASSKTLCVEQDGKLLCAKDWADLYLPKCRKCREPVEKNAVKSADGALVGIFHRDCLCCFECDVAFEDGEFYIFENTPYCAEHYHIRNGSLCAACGSGIEGHCRQTESGERFHPRCLRCEYETSTEFCQESLEIFWELDGQKLCERHMEKTRRRLERKGRKNVNASKRRTMLREIKA